MSEHLIDDLLEFLENFDLLWKEKSDQIYEKKLSLTDPIIIKINHIRQAIRFYIMPLLKEYQNASAAKQKELLNLMTPLSSKEDVSQFFKHFYEVDENEEGEWFFRDYDPYQWDLFILYDLYKTKKHLELAIELLTEVESGCEFQSQLNQSDQIKLLKGIRAALVMTFKQSLKSEYVNDLYKNIRIDDLSPKSIKERQKKKILYGRESTLDGSPYQRIFLHLMFKKKIKTQVKGKEATIHYDLIQFERLKREYFSHWMKGLEEEPEKIKAYQKLSLDKKTLAQWLTEDPTIEGELLNQLSSQQFNQLVHEVSRKVSESKRPTVTPLSEDAGVLGELNQQFNSLLGELKNSLHLEPQKQHLEILKTLVKKSKKISTKIPQYHENQTKLQQLLKKAQGDRPEYQEASLDATKKPHILLLLKESVFDQHKERLQELQKIRKVSIQLSTPQQLLLQDLQATSLLLKFQCDLPEQDRNGLPIPQELTYEKLDLDFPLKDFPIPAKVTSQGGFVELMDEVASIDEDQTFQEVYQQQRLVWVAEKLLAEQANELDSLGKSIQKSISQYQMLLYWLMIEALEGAGHLRGIIEQLTKASRCLLIDDLGYDISSYFYSIGFDPQILSIWDKARFKVELEERSDGPKTLQEFFQHSRFERFDLILMASWENSNDGQLPIHIFVADRTSPGAVNQFYSIDLYQLFQKDQSFLKVCFDRMQSLQGIATQLNQSPHALDQLKETHRPLQSTNDKIKSLSDYLEHLKSDLAASKAKHDYDTFENDLEQHILNRVRLFSLLHQARSPQ